MHRDSSESERFWRHLEPLQAALEAYCRRCVRDANLSEDVLQEAVMTAFRDFHRFSEGTNFRAWIFRYLNLTILAANRTARTHQRRPSEEDVTAAVKLSQPIAETMPLLLVESPDEVLQHCDDVLRRAVNRLNWLERSSLLLKAIGQFRYREISEILGQPMGTVMSALARARQKLRRELAQYAACNRPSKPAPGCPSRNQGRGSR